MTLYSVYLNLYFLNLNVRLQDWGLLVIWALGSWNLIHLCIIALKNIKRPHIFLGGHLRRPKGTIMWLRIIEYNHRRFDFALIALPYQCVHVRSGKRTRYGSNLYLPMSVFILLLNLKDMRNKLRELVWLRLDATSSLWPLLERNLAWATLWLVAAKVLHLMSYCHRALRFSLSFNYSLDFL